jgi:hypothetical protein
MFQKTCYRKSNTHFIFVTFLGKSRSLCDNAKKHCRAVQVTDDSMAHAHCMSIPKATKPTLRVCSAYCLSTATTVARTRLSVTLYANCLFCLPFTVYVMFSGRNTDHDNPTSSSSLYPCILERQQFSGT